jgi:CBS domain-containing protein
MPSNATERDDTMEVVRIKQLMVPLAEYATVSENATLYEALVALEEAQKSVSYGHDRYRAVLVLDEASHIVGKVNLWDVLKGIEPRYTEMSHPREVAAHGSTSEYSRSLIQTYGLWHRPLEEICRNAAELKVDSVMHSLNESEYIREDASLDEGINQLLLGEYQSLLVTRGEDVIGVLRLSDVFVEICERIRKCRS